MPLTATPATVTHPPRKAEPMPLKSFLNSLLLLSAGAVALASNPDTEPRTMQMLSNETIFKADQYEAREPGAMQWLTARNAYTAVEPAPGYEDSDPGVGEDGEKITPPQDIVAYDLATLERRVLVTS